MYGFVKAKLEKQDVLKNFKIYQVCFGENYVSFTFLCLY